MRGLATIRQYGKLFALLLPFWCVLSVYAQPISFRYFYDDDSRLFRVLDSTGNLVEYDHDPAGNITQITRSNVAPGSLAILNVAPGSAFPGASMMVYGQGFSTTPGNNIVTVGGIAATVVSATATQLIIQVPAGAATGQISVTVNGVTATSGSGVVFNPPPVPVITSVTPDGALANTTVKNIQVTGTNLKGAVFTLPSGGTVTAGSVTPSSATIQIATSTTRGSFPLIATTQAGSSTSNVTAGNHFIVMITPDETDTAVFTVLNSALPPGGVSLPAGTNSTDSYLVSVLNTAAPAGGVTDPTIVSQAADSLAVTVLNQTQPSSLGPDPTIVENEADSAVASVQNGSSSSEPAPAPTPNLATEFASVHAPAGTMEAPPEATAAVLIAGQTVNFGLRAPEDTQAVELLLDGKPFLRSSRFPWVFSFNVPSGRKELALTAIALDASGRQGALTNWRQPIDSDAGTQVTARVVDDAGSPVAGAKVTVESTALYAELLEAPASARAARSAVVAGLNWTGGTAGFGLAGFPDGSAPGFVVRFTGGLVVPQTGQYTFGWNVSGDAGLVLDGRPVAGSVMLAAGPHALELVDREPGGAARLELVWTRPDGVTQAIPADALRAIDPALQSVSGSDGTVRVASAPANVQRVRVLVTLPDGRTGVSIWQAPVNGGVTDFGNVRVRLSASKPVGGERK